MEWQEESREEAWTRREWVKLGMAVGTIGAIGGLATDQLLPPPITASGQVHEKLVYVKFPKPQ